MNESTLRSAINATFSRSRIEKAAADNSLVERRGGKVQPVELVLALLGASVVGATRSIAEIRRRWSVMANETITRSAFDAHFNKPALGATLWQLVEQSMRASNRALKRQWPLALRLLTDVIIEDGTRMKLPSAASATFPSTEVNGAGIKLMARISLGDGKLKALGLGTARSHDHALKLEAELAPGTLILRDLGFYDHQEFLRIDNDGAFYISRLKANIKPIVDGTVIGMLLPEEWSQDIPLQRDLTEGRTSDVDVRLSLPNKASVRARVVRVRFVENNRRGQFVRMTDRWYVTNLPREEWSVDTIDHAYKLRWAIERFFRRAKSNARMDQLQTTRETAIVALLGASLLVMMLSDRIAYILQRDHGLQYVSVERCALIVCSALPELIRAVFMRRGKKLSPLAGLAKIIDHESRHPNNTQPHLVHKIFTKVLAA